jgi:ABC-type multidrug transport system permease subunit
MKQFLKIIGNSKNYLAIGALFFFQNALFAQDDKTLDVNLNVDGGQSEWYTEPWMIVVGVAVFIIIIVALVRGKGGK